MELTANAMISHAIDTKDSYAVAPTMEYVRAANASAKNLGVVQRVNAKRPLILAMHRT